MAFKFKQPKYVLHWGHMTEVSGLNKVPSSTIMYNHTSGYILKFGNNTFAMCITFCEFSLVLDVGE